MAPQAMTQRTVEALELVVDETTLGAVLKALEEICYRKAARLGTGGLDRQGARCWSKAARLLGQVEARVEV